MGSGEPSQVPGQELSSPVGGGGRPMNWMARTVSQAPGSFGSAWLPPLPEAPSCNQTLTDAESGGREGGQLPGG